MTKVNQSLAETGLDDGMTIDEMNELQLNIPKTMFQDQINCAIQMSRRIQMRIKPKYAASTKIVSLKDISQKTRHTAM